MTDFALHIFRRDLRLEDNTALNEALASGLPVIPVFIFDPAQSAKHPYFSEPGFKFLLESLSELNSELLKRGSHLRVFQGDPSEVILNLCTTKTIKLITFNRDYTPFAKQRDQALFTICSKHNVECKILDDALINKPETSVKSDGSPYTVFTPFFRKNRLTEVLKPHTKKGTFVSSKVSFTGEKNIELIQDKNYLHATTIRGSRNDALKTLESISNFADYKQTRDFPALDSTTHLSSHHKFGTVSIREAYHQISQTLTSDHTLITELYWRDFFTSIGFFFPHVFSGAFNREYNNLQWSEDEDQFSLWAEGRTGFPIVDAGMRELNQTGFMHNRVRMIVASFLTKDLRISWRWGERYFATKLIDYDPSVNNGNWQWAASTGCDAQPYFRIFNPWLQQKKFDPDCVYIKKWVPELIPFKTEIIHRLDTNHVSETVYPTPCVNHSDASAETKQMFKNTKIK